MFSNLKFKVELIGDFNLFLTEKKKIVQAEIARLEKREGSEGT